MQKIFEERFKKVMIFRLKGNSYIRYAEISSYEQGKTPVREN